MKATVLLGLAWMIHYALARTNPRWRVLLGRATAVALVALPLLGGVLPAIDLPIRPPDRSISPTTPAPTPTGDSRLSV